MIVSGQFLGNAQVPLLPHAEAFGEVPTLIPECLDSSASQYFPDAQSPPRAQQKVTKTFKTPGRGQDQDTVLDGNQSQQPRRSSRLTRGVTNKYVNHYTGNEYEGHMNDSIVQCGRPMVVGEIVGTGYSLMAMQLPTGFEDKSAFWSPEGWTWVQH